MLSGSVTGLALLLAKKHTTGMTGGQFRRTAATVVTAELLIIFAANLLWQPLDPYVCCALAVTGALACGMILSLRFHTPDWLRALCNPAVSALSLVGVLWIAKELPGEHTPTGRLVAAGVYFMTVSATVLVVRRLFLSRYTGLGSGRNNNTKLVVWLSAAGCLILLFAMQSLRSSRGPTAESNAKGTPRHSTRPNVVLVTMDTVRADHLSVYGYRRDTTPNLRKFAAEATVYSQAVSTSDMTLASHASMFSSLYPSQHGAHYAMPDYPWGRPILDNVKTLPELLSERGYLTMGVVGNYAYLGRWTHMDRGFRFYHDSAPVPVLDFRRRHYIRSVIRAALNCLQSTAEFDAEYENADEIDQHVYPLLEHAQGQGRPFFLFVNYMDAHWPLIPPAPYDTLYPGIDRSFTSTRAFDILKDELSLKRPISKQEKEHLTAEYDGGVAFIDAHVGRLIRYLRERRLLGTTLVIVSADHGEAFGERNLLGHLVSVYQDQVHVPLIIRYPGSGARAVVGERVSGVDILPTVMDVLGYAAPGGIEGKSLLRLRPAETRVLISESFPVKSYLDMHPTRFHRVQRAMFAGSLKFVGSTAGERELYDLSRDPEEERNICGGEYGETCREMQANLQRWARLTGRDTGPAVKLNRDTLNRLRSLGYVQ
jgi:arylsulfatase A-like enzyme